MVLASEFQSTSTPAATIVYGRFLHTLGFAIILPLVCLDPQTPPVVRKWAVSALNNIAWTAESAIPKYLPELRKA
jgi:hypothetical protein